LRNRLTLLASMAMACIAAPLGAQRVPDAAIPSEADAPIAYLLDATSGQVLYQREIDRRFMPASITKVMTTFLAFEWIDEGRLLRERIFGVRPETFRQWHRKGSTMFLAEDARVSVDDLLHGVTTVSANDGAVVLAEGAAGSVEDWVAAMNAKAREIGMANSHFGNPNGWMDEGRTFVTARDLGTLAQAMVVRHPTKYRHFVGAQGLEYNGIEQRNHDPITGVVPGADGIKTGYTNQAGFGFLGSAERDGQRLVMVVAGSPGGRERRRAARQFIEWGFRNFDSRVLFAPNARIGTARVQEGGAGTVGLTTPRPLRIAVPRGRDPEISLTISYEGPLQAPVAKGEEVAELVVSIAGMPEHRVPLVAAEEVSEASIVRRVFNAFQSWLG